LQKKNDCSYKKITIRGIAQKGAISVSTVSGVLSGRNGFSKATQKRAADMSFTRL
jgi:DNA-binding LacI/PurR family transcriptional regulator